jgi:hypothetical protein
MPDAQGKTKRSKMIGELLEIAKFILGFLPWILFLVLPTDGWDPLRRAVVICLAVSVISAWKAPRKGFILQWATLVFFLFCTISLYGFRWIWLAKHMGIIANGFLDGLIWFTVLIGKPFTLQYARADLPQEQWYDEGLIRGCRFIAIFWGTLLLVPTAFNAFRLFYPVALPVRFYFYLSLFCIIIGISYTTFYKHKKRKQREAMS